MKLESEHKYADVQCHLVNIFVFYVYSSLFPLHSSIAGVRGLVCITHSSMMSLQTCCRVAEHYRSVYPCQTVILRKGSVTEP